jgi:D-tyrosyl-tRNA(Tyr) deacylase
MIAVVQRVREASVTVEAAGHHERIGPGLCVLLGIETGDTERDAEWMAGKLARLRIFRDDEGKMNRSVQDIGGEVLVVSQFTLAGDCSKGNRPSFITAADPELGQRLYESVAARLEREHGEAWRLRRDDGRRAGQRRTGDPDRPPRSWPVMREHGSSDERGGASQPIAMPALLTSAVPCSSTACR